MTVSRPDFASKNEILLAVQKVKVGMSAKEMTACIVPVSNGGTPAIRFLPNNTAQYYFEIGDNSQIWVKVANPGNLPSLGSMTPNGTVIAIGKIKPVTKKIYKREDSNEIE